MREEASLMHFTDTLMNIIYCIFLFFHSCYSLEAIVFVYTVVDYYTVGLICHTTSTIMHVTISFNMLCILIGQIHNNIYLMFSQNLKN